MEVMFDKPARFYNDYSIKANNDNHHIIPWESYNPALGKLIGNFTIEAETITSRYVSDDARCNGSEILTQLDEHTYKATGECHMDG